MNTVLRRIDFSLGERGYGPFFLEETEESSPEAFPVSGGGRSSGGLVLLHFSLERRKERAFTPQGNPFLVTMPFLVNSRESADRFTSCFPWWLRGKSLAISRIMATTSFSWRSSMRTLPGPQRKPKGGGPKGRRSSRREYHSILCAIAWHFAHRGTSWVPPRDRGTTWCQCTGGAAPHSKQLFPLSIREESSRSPNIRESLATCSSVRRRTARCSEVRDMAPYYRACEDERQRHEGKKKRKRGLGDLVPYLHRPNAKQCYEGGGTWAYMLIW